MLSFLSLGALVLVFLGVMVFLTVRPASPLENALKRFRFQASDLWRWDGTVDRGPYASLGVTLFAVKHNLDRLIAAAVFRRRWEPLNYLIPSGGMKVNELKRPDAVFYGTLLLVALPFIWTGVVMTLRRLRSARLPAWLIGLFFVPFVNLLFLLVMAMVPPRRDGEDEGGPASLLERWIPRSGVGSAAMSLALTLPVATAFAWLGTTCFKTYGWGLFVGIPFCQGLMAVLLYGSSRPRNYGSCLLVACFSTILTGAALLAFAFEGVLCLAMAFPFALALSVLGGTVGYLLQRRPRGGAQAGPALAALLVGLPILMGAEWSAAPEPPVWAVRTTIDVAAPPSKVWVNVITFAELPPPTEAIFKLGVAHPLRAVIDGKGPGAVRHCVFSTGEFTEPIEIWDEPRLLKFSVSAQPPTMREWSPYPDLHAPHLEGYLRSQGGQFLLTPLADGGTRLEGTTWYTDRMWPAFYWKLWSDAVIHRIHLRVLRHIQRAAETGPR